MRKKVIYLLLVLLIISIFANIMLTIKLLQPKIKEEHSTNIESSNNYKYRISSTFYISDNNADKEKGDSIYKYYEDFSNSFYEIIENNAQDILDVSKLKERVTITSSEKQRYHNYTLCIYGNNQEELIETGKAILKILTENIPLKYNYEVKIIDGFSYSGITKISD